MTYGGGADGDGSVFSLKANATGQTFTLGGTAVAVDWGLAATSYDTDLTGASETITNYQSGDLLNFTNTAQITGNYASGVLSLTGSATPAQYTAALASVTFSTASTVKGTRTVDVVADDSNDTGNAPSNTGVDSVVVAIAAPTVTTSGSTGQTDTLGGPPVSVDSGLTVTSGDADITGASMTISNDQSGDVLNYTPMDGITIASNSGGVLTLTGSATPAQYTAALQSVTFSTTSLVKGARTIDVVALDGAATPTTSNTGVDTVVVAIAPPVIGGHAGISYTAGQAAQTLDSTLTVSSADADVTGATLTISAGTLQAGDMLNFANQNGISGVYSGGALTLTGNATPAQYQAALRSITFSNATGTNLTARNISIVVSDSGDTGNTSSNTASETVAVTAPVTITGVWIDNPTWGSTGTKNFFGYLASHSTAGQVANSTALGYALQSGASQLTPLPWANVNTISVQFSGAISNIGLASLELLGGTGLGSVPAPSVIGFASDGNNTYSWTLASPLGNNKYVLAIATTGSSFGTAGSTQVVDANGAGISGTFINSTSTPTTGQAFPSGNGLAGSTFDFFFNVLPGDGNQGPLDNATDTALAYGKNNDHETSAGYNPYVDYYGAGIINATDAAIDLAHNNIHNNTITPPTAPADSQQVGTTASTPSTSLTLLALSVLETRSTQTTSLPTDTAGNVVSAAPASAAANSGSRDSTVGSGSESSGSAGAGSSTTVASTTSSRKYGGHHFAAINEALSDFDLADLYV